MGAALRLRGGRVDSVEAAKGRGGVEAAWGDSGHSNVRCPGGPRNVAIDLVV